MIDKTTSLENALKDIRDGDTIMVGGFGVSGTPFSLIDGLLDVFEMYNSFLDMSCLMTSA